MVAGLPCCLGKRSAETKTLNPKPQTPNPKPETLDPKPSPDAIDQTQAMGGFGLADDDDDEVHGKKHDAGFIGLMGLTGLTVKYVAVWNFTWIGDP